MLDTVTLVAAVIGLIACTVQIFSAVATWYSRCFKISLGYGFLILFAPLLVSIIGGAVLHKQPVAFSYFMLSMSIIYTIIVSYGVYKQFTSQCDLGYKKPAKMSGTLPSRSYNEMMY